MYTFSEILNCLRTFLIEEEKKEKILKFAASINTNSVQMNMTNYFTEISDYTYSGEHSAP